MRWQDKLSNPCHRETVRFIEHLESVGVATKGELRKWFDTNYVSLYPGKGYNVDSTFGMYFNVLASLRLAVVTPDESDSDDAVVKWRGGEE
jgi:hypothetical protein